MGGGADGGYVTSQHHAEEALMTSVAEGDIFQVRVALSEGVDPDCVDDEMSTPLHVAAFLGHVEIVELILQTSRKSLEAMGQLSATPLHVAATAGRNDVVKLLLNANAIVDARDEAALTPLVCAQTSPPLVDPTLKISCVETHAQHRAAQAGFGETAQLLLSSRATVDARNLDEYTPLHVAAMQGGRGRAVVACLLGVGAAVDARTGHGETAADLLLRGQGADALTGGGDASQLLEMLEPS